ncbi:MAG: trypsin-like peptidase domain-containing protein [Myxococcaceae bacterium]
MKRRAAGNAGLSLRVIAMMSLLCFGCATVMVSHAPSRDATSLEVLDRALPAVVLLLAQRADGTVGYGAGLIVSLDGMVVTNLHVVTNAQSLSALLYRRDRVSYTPMDGGLKRYLFENNKELVGARLVRGDPTTDLALVKVDADTSNVTLLELSSRPPKPGESVLALGHPQETVWSFTAGVVSAIHHGAIQHDAAVNHGNSGGPLLTARGEVVGINTSKVLGGADGLAFARPIDFVRDLLAQVQEPRALDLSSPEKAVLSCFHAQELASADIAQCFDWDTRWTAFETAVREYAAAGTSNPELAKGARDALARMGGKEGWIEARKRAIVAFARDSSPAANGSVKSDRYDRRLLKQNGLKLDVLNPREIQEVLRMGIRVESVNYPRPDLAWVLITGRNTDGTEYRFSECWVKKGDRWLQRTPAQPEDEKLLPKDFAPPLDDYAAWRERMVQALVNGAIAASSPA